MRAVLIGILGLLATAGAAVAAEGGADAALAKDIASFPDITLIHPSYDMPSGWRPADAGPGVVADFDRDGRNDVAMAIVNTADGSRAVAVYLARFVVGPGRYTQPVVLSEKALSDLTARR